VLVLHALSRLLLYGALASRDSSGNRRVSEYAVLLRAAVERRSRRS
jgi:hypothetical protein